MDPDTIDTVINGAKFAAVVGSTGLLYLGFFALCVNGKMRYDEVKHLQKRYDNGEIAVRPTFWNLDRVAPVSKQYSD